MKSNSIALVLVVVAAVFYFKSQLWLKFTMKNERWFEVIKRKLWVSSVGGCGGDDGGYPPSLQSSLVPHAWARGSSYPTF